MTLQAVSGGWVATRRITYTGVGHVYGLPYHQVVPVLLHSEWSEIEQWCQDIFGPSGTQDKPGVWTPGERWYANSGKLFFREETDLSCFLLRWS